MIKRKFGQRIKFLRKIKKLNQEQLAFALGMSKQQVSRIERGVSAPSFEALQNICAKLETCPAILFMFSENDDPLQARNIEEGICAELAFSKWGLLSIDLQTGRESWSRSLQNLLGDSQDYSEPFINLFSQYLDTRDVKTFTRIYQQAAQGITGHRLNLRLKRQDGLRRVFYLGTDSIPDSQENHIISFLNFLDVTELLQFKNNLMLNHEELEKAIQEKTKTLHTALQDKEKELQLRKKREQEICKYKKMVESSSDPMVFMDCNYRCLLANQSAARLWEVNFEDIQKQPVWNLTGQELFEQKIKPCLEGALKGRKLREQCWTMVARGKQRFLDFYFSPHYEIEQICGIVLVTRDLTENQNLFLELEKFKKAVNSSLAAIATTDRQGRLIQANPAFVSLWGYLSQQEVLGRHISKFWNKRTEKFCDSGSVLDPESWSGHLQALRKDNTTFRVKALVSPLLDCAGNIRGVTGSFWKEGGPDKSEQTNQAGFEKRYQILFAQCSEAIFLHDIKGNIKEANQAALDIFGYSQEEMLQLHPLDLVHPQDVALVEEKFATIMRKGCASAEHRCLRKNGSEIIVHVKGKKISKYLIQGILRDITAQKRLEEHKQDAQRILNHDLKSPLEEVITLTQAMCQADNLTAEQRQGLQMILNSGKNMLKMINLSQIIFQIEENSYQVSLQDCDLLEILVQVRSEIEKIAALKKVGLHFSLYNNHGQTSEQVIVKAEYPLIYALVLNLLKNAVEASPCGKRVDINLYQKRSILLEIVNCGTVPREIRDKFFDKYVTAGKKKGIGLGTYSAKLLADLMGFAIDMQTLDKEELTKLTLHIA